MAVDLLWGERNMYVCICTHIIHSQKVQLHGFGHVSWILCFPVALGAKWSFFEFTLNFHTYKYCELKCLASCALLSEKLQMISRVEAAVVDCGLQVLGYFFIADFSLQYNLWELEFRQEAGIYNNMNFHKTILIWSFSNEGGGNLWPIIQLM